MDEERWRPVVGLEDSYEVSDRGQVRSLIAARYRSFRTTRFPTMTTLQRNSAGYVMVLLTVSPNTKRGFMVHRLVATAFLDAPAEDEIEVHHKNHVRDDNHYTNLEWVTVKANRADRRPPARPRYATLYAIIATLLAENARLRGAPEVHDAAVEPAQSRYLPHIRWSSHDRHD